MSASVIASALLAAVNLSISKPEEYVFVEPVETNLLAGVGMGAALPTDDAPLRYEDAAFLTEAYAERYYAFYSSLARVPSKTNGWINVEASVSLARLSGYLSTITCGSNNTWLADFDIPDSLAVVSGDDILTALAGTNAAYEAFNENVTRDALKSGAPLDASVIAALYENVAKMKRVYSGVDIKADGSIGSNGNYYYYSETHTDNSGFVDADGEPLGYTSGTTTNLNFFTSADYLYKFDDDGSYSKDNFASGGRVNYSHGGSWKYSKTVCPGVILVAEKTKHLLEDLTALPFMKVKSMRLFGKGSYSLTYVLETTPAGDADNTTTKTGTNGTFIVEIPIVDVEADGSAVSYVGMWSDDSAIKDAVCGLFGDNGPASLAELKKATPEPETPVEVNNTIHSTSSDTSFSRNIEIRDFGVVVELEFNARVSDGE